MITPPKETLVKRLVEPAVGAGDGGRDDRKFVLACAVKSKSSPQLDESVLSLRMGLEPIFWKNSFQAK